MSFDRILRRIVDETSEAIGAIFIDREGEAIAHYSTRSGDEMKLVGAHYGIIWLELETVVQQYLKSSISETILTLERGICLLRPLQGEYLLLLVIAPSGGMGQARRWLRWAASEIQLEL
ncbi:MAG: hypothetical protein HY282_17460 [Nitrospirae bacterium]|nr:hypothetical protein [Candidatus Manganitrophaceae bacterium]